MLRFKDKHVLFFIQSKVGIMKKTRKSNLENKKTLFFEMGLVTVLGLLLVAFNWNTPQGAAKELGTITAVPLEDDLVQRTIQEEIKPPPPPPREVIVTELKIIDNTGEDDDFTIDTEFFSDEAIRQTDIMPEPEKEEKEEHPFVWVPSQKAQFPGGEAARLQYLRDELKYPRLAKEHDISGRVDIQFKVGAYGEIMEIKVLRSPDPLLTKEALRVVKNMPRWEPAKQGGKRVVTLVSIPIVFSLR